MMQPFSLLKVSRIYFCHSDYFYLVNNIELIQWYMDFLAQQIIMQLVKKFSASLSKVRCHVHSL